MMEDKYIGLALAVLSSLSIGSSMVITKIGLTQANERHGFEGDGFQYLRNPIWWVGTSACVFGEILNAAAYAFAPAILVTPLGAFSVLIGAVLSAYFLSEKLGLLGKLGCAACFLGSFVLVLHAPPDREIQTIDEIFDLAMQPLFLLYGTIVTVFAAYMIFKIAPVHGKTNPLVYVSICATIGSIAVMAIKAFGVAVKLTLAGSNQFTHPSTYVFAVVLVSCLMTQTAYLNKAMSQFPTSIVNALYYVTFTTCTLSASFILFRGLDTVDIVNTVLLLAGFLVLLAGVYLLTMPNRDLVGYKTANTDSRYDGIELLGQVLVPWRHQNYSRSCSSIGSIWSSDREGNSSANSEFEPRSLSSKARSDGETNRGLAGDSSNSAAIPEDTMERRRDERGNR